MPDLSLSFYGVEGRVSGDAGALSQLKRDFEYFSASRTRPRFRVNLRREAPDLRALKGARPAFGGRGFTAYHCGGRRLIDYERRALAEFNPADESIEIQSEDPSLLHELGYLAVCSRAGWHLDLKGLHRVHALGLARGGRGALVLLPSGGGKTTLLLESLRAKGVSVLSDDTPLVDASGRLHPFPLRLGLTPEEPLDNIPVELRRPFMRRQFGPKVLVDLPYFRARVAKPVPCGLLIVGRRRRDGRVRTHTAGPGAGAWALFSSLIVGWGVPQLAEFMRPSGLREAAALAGVAFSRARAAAALLKAPVKRLELSSDRAAGWRALESLLEREL